MYKSLFAWFVALALSPYPRNAASYRQVHRKLIRSALLRTQGHGRPECSLTCSTHCQHPHLANYLFSGLFVFICFPDRHHTQGDVPQAVTRLPLMIQWICSRLRSKHIKGLKEHYVLGQKHSFVQINALLLNVYLSGQKHNFVLIK